MFIGTRITTMGVTGQRPKSLGLDTFNPKDPIWKDSERYITTMIIRHTPKRLVSGGALGFDMVAAKAAIDANIELYLFMPFEGYDSWPEKDRNRLQWLRERATEERFICEPGYAPWKYQKRNEAIVSESDFICAFHDGSSGGTKNCIDAAERAGVGYYAYKPRKNLIKAYT